MDNLIKKNYCRELKQLSANIKYEIVVEKELLLFSPVGSQFDKKNISGVGSANLVLSDDKSVWTREYLLSNLRGNFFIALILFIVGRGRSESKTVFSWHYFLDSILLPLLVVTIFLFILRIGIQYIHIINSANKKPYPVLSYDKSTIKSIVFRKYDFGAKPNIGKFGIGSIKIILNDGKYKKFYGHQGIDMKLIIENLIKYGYSNVEYIKEKSFLFKAFRG